MREFKVPCGQCIGCRDGYARQWSIRCWHESFSHKENSFLTLTVDDDHIQEVFPNGSLRYEPFQEFIRSFRKSVGVPIRFFMCGEYGDKLSRPHYHSIIFGWFPSFWDRSLYKKTSVGPLYISKLITKRWPFGFHTVGNFTRETAGYVAGYMQKKINGKLAPKWYGGKLPEFARMSLGTSKDGPKGIGAGFYKKYVNDIFDAKDGIVLPGGSTVSVPRYYDKLHACYHPIHMSKVKARRAEPDPVRDFHSTSGRLAVREGVHRSRLSKGKRSLH